LEEANNIFKLMLEKGLVPNVQIYSKMIISNCERGCIKGALKLHYEMQDKGLLPALETYHSLIYRLCKERDTDGALTIYNEMEAKSMLPTVSCKLEVILCFSTNNLEGSGNFSIVENQ